MKFYSWIAAVLGGYATATALRYVLVQAWLPRYVPGESTADASQMTISAIVGAVLLIASAALTARWSSAKGRAGAAGAGAPFPESKSPNLDIFSNNYFEIIYQATSSTNSPRIFLFIFLDLRLLAKADLI